MEAPRGVRVLHKPQIAHEQHSIKATTTKKKPNRSTAACRWTFKHKQENGAILEYIAVIHTDLQ